MSEIPIHNYKKHYLLEYIMAELKTKENNASVKGFIEAIKDPQEREDAFTLLAMFKEATKQEPKMWGSAIIGFGKYHYKSERSKQEGDWPLTGFSPRSQSFSLYLMCGVDAHKSLLKDLGKYKKSSGSCLYIKRLADVDLDVLKKMIAEAYKLAQEKYSTK